MLDPAKTLTHNVGWTRPDKSFRGTMFYREDAPDGHGGNWDLHIIREVFQNDCYRLLGRTLEKVESIIDVGAHIGSFTVLAKSIWPTAWIQAFEPVHSNFAVLQMNTAKMDRTILYQAAVTWKDGMVNFRPPGLNTGEGAVDEKGSDYVQARRLSHYLRNFAPGVDLLKLDCEQSEGAILESLTEDEKRDIRIIVGEYHGNHMPNVLYKALGETHRVSLLKPLPGAIGLFEATRR